MVVVPNVTPTSSSVSYIETLDVVLVVLKARWHKGRRISDPREAFWMVWAISQKLKFLSSATSLKCGWWWIFRWMKRG
ncbi:hypothetical protein FHX77_000811 [Bifidobacterium commune]|uniref:Uncharacterized protein n=1 Tax=Bifidobacterium commune TaxID=1505727 RepID=A0A1C4H5W8_9BIFI|nr:hypothetical protein [Bifidobacterium commune]SCC80153.1 hypothetical protein GA0061077_1076 [Bifidobacterium commune]